MMSDRVRSARRRPARPALRLGFAGAITAATLVALASMGGLSYAATAIQTAAATVTHVVTPSKSAVPSSAVSSAQDQYGKKVSICAVGPNGKQHTITISKNAAPNYLRTHPDAFLGSCGAFRPHGAKANVCLFKNGKFVPVFVPPGRVNSYLSRNPKSHTTKTGKC